MYYNRAFDTIIHTMLDTALDASGLEIYCWAFLELIHIKFWAWVLSIILCICVWSWCTSNCGPHTIIMHTDSENYCHITNSILLLVIPQQDGEVYLTLCLDDYCMTIARLIYTMSQVVCTCAYVYVLDKLFSYNYLIRYKLLIMVFTLLLLCRKSI